jgi:hypothetical protein
VKLFHDQIDNLSLYEITVIAIATYLGAIGISALYFGERVRFV